MFQKYLNKELYKRDWSQRELAGKVGVHESLVSRWMKGERVPNTSQHYQAGFTL